jgi:FkbM family methyltransferase
VTQGFLNALKRTDPSFRPKVIFDVGANVGRTAEQFLASFPEARVYCFEPAPATFATLSGKLGADARVSLHQLALDSSDREVRFTNAKGSKENRILRERETADEAEVVQALRADAFCATRALEEIDIVKVDTEGNDLKVLVGFTGRLQAKAVRYLQVECTPSPDNRLHVQLGDFLQFLAPFGYRLFGLFEFNRQIHRTRQKLNGIWFCNAVFVREVENPRLRRLALN